MQPDYLAFNSMSFSNGANRDTELQVIVYQYWNADEVVAEIEAIMELLFLRKNWTVRPL